MRNSDIIALNLRINNTAIAPLKRIDIDTVADIKKLDLGYAFISFQNGKYRVCEIIITGTFTTHYQGVNGQDARQMFTSIV